MSRLLLLTSLSLIAMLMFATVALAQEEDGGQPAARGAEAGLGQPSVVTSAEADGGQTGGAGGGATATATASPTATATATASPTATATASSTATATASPTATATALAGTGGPVSVNGLIGLMAAVSLLGGGAMSFALVRRS